MRPKLQQVCQEVNRILLRLQEVQEGQKFNGQVHLTTFTNHLVYFYNDLRQI
jgi:hypothetical protein